MVGKIVRMTGLGHITLVFCAIFLASSLVIALAEPAAGGWGNALWLCFQTITTIGFGDVPADTLVVRCTLVILSVVSVFYLAVVTGVVVAYCNELIKAHTNESLLELADRLEHLEELDQAELEQISRQVRTWRSSHT